MPVDPPVARLERDGRVATLLIDYPPVNALGLPVRRALIDAIEEVERDATLEALVIRCAGRTFFSGADIREFDQPPMEPFLPDVVDRIEACTKPVVAAIHGTALGGGLEVAMGCHGRVALTSATLGLPEVKLGLMPGAGGTQRLPRLIGIEKALAMMTFGDPIGAVEAGAIGLVDRVVDDGLAEAAITFALALASSPAPAPATRDRLLAPPQDPAFFDDFVAANARRFAGFDAPGAIVETARRTIALPFAEGRAIERAAFLALRSGPQSDALRHAFFAERASARVAGIGKDTPVVPIGRVAVIGAGTMGSGIALACLAAGLPVTLIETTQAALDRGLAVIAKALDDNVAKGRISAAAAKAAGGSLLRTLDFGAETDADLVIEAAFETMAVKADIFAALDAHAQPDAILATNTSYLDIDAIAALTKRPEGVIGLHFFSPANVMKLLEIVRGARTSDTVVATALAFAKSIGKIAVVVGNGHGFVGNRMLAVRRREAEAMLLAGVSPYVVDRVAEEFGMPMGPFRIGDLAGLDLGWSAAASSGSTIRERLCEAGRRGQKSGAGFYDHIDGKAVRSDEASAIIRRFVEEKGGAASELSDREILVRLLFPMIDEGARILAKGKAARASDIDVIWLHGYGWPRWTGGPMHYADTVGLAGIVAELDALGTGYAPCALLRDLAARGACFADFDKKQAS